MALRPSITPENGTVPFATSGAYLVALDYTIRKEIAALDFTDVANWYSSADVPVEVISGMLDFFGIEPLDTEILGEQYKRAVYGASESLRRLRGTAAVLNLYSGISGTNYTYTLRYNTDGRPTGVDFLLTPPLGRLIDTDWQSFIKKAIEFLLPPHIGINLFTIGFNTINHIHVYNGFIMRDVYY